MRSSTVGSCCSAGRYSLLMIDGGTFQVGLTVMNFIVSVSSGVALVAGLAAHDLGLPHLRAVLHHPQGEVGNVDHHVGVAEVARQPAPALHVGEDDVDVAVALRPVDRVDRRGGELAARRQMVALLEFLHRLGDGLVVGGVAGVAGDAEALAQQRHARILHRGLRHELEHRARRDARRPAAVLGGARLGELRLERLVAGVRRIEPLERAGDVLAVDQAAEHVGGLRRRQVVGDVAADAREVDAADLRVARIGQHGLGVLELGIGERAGVGAGLDLGHRIVGRIEAVGRRHWPRTWRPPCCDRRHCRCRATAARSRAPRRRRRPPACSCAR